MTDLHFISYSGLFGISYLYWAILSFLLAMVTLFIQIPAFALPKNPSNWMLKKTVLNYFHSTAWFILAYVCYRLYRRNGDLSFWLGIWLGIALILAVAFLTVWALDRLQLRKLKEKKQIPKEQ